MSQLNSPQNKSKLEIQEQLQETVSQGSPLPVSWNESKRQTNIESELTKREALKNQALEQDIKLKRITLSLLFAFLTLETIAVFAFAYFQGVGINDFKLEEWSFKLLLSATILQITYMLQVAVKHLFPNKNSDEKK